MRREVGHPRELAYRVTWVLGLTLGPVGDTVKWSGAVREEDAVAVWVNPSKIKIRGEGDTRPRPTASHRKLHRTGMDITWLTDRIAVGGGIWNAENMANVARAGITHIIDMQIEFDDTPLGVAHGIEVLWNPTDDDFEAKPPALFQRGVDFALQAFEGTDAKLFIHCAAGVHRAPMMALAVLVSTGWSLADAKELIVGRRPVADLAEVYVESVERFLGAGDGES